MVLCKSRIKSSPITNPKGIPLRNHADYSVRFFRSMADTPTDWDLLQPADDVFLQRDYLQMLENNPPEDYEFCYTIYYKHNQPIGISYGQILDFKTNAVRDKSNNGAWTKAVSFAKNIIVDKVHFRMVVGGNALVTGEHGFNFIDEIPFKKQFELYSEALLQVRATLADQGDKINSFLVKDFFRDSIPHCEKLEEKAFHQIAFQPCMLMDLDPTWNTFEDYLAAFTSKYRTRAKRAFKKGKDFVKQSFNLERIRLHQDELFAYYKDIESTAGFSFVHLNKDYMIGLKEVLGDDFNLTGYWLDGKLVGFYTTILSGDEMEAHFIGFDQSLNHSHQIYLNMLYDMVREGIDKGTKRIIFARTAMEIKSSVGAIGVETYCYFRHTNELINRVAPRIVASINPVEEWTPRQPFKTS